GPGMDVHLPDLRDLAKKEAEPRDGEAEGHERDAGANPREHGPLVRGVVAKLSVRSGFVRHVAPSGASVAPRGLSCTFEASMCELLGMDCNVPTDIVFSFSGLALRGGQRGPHADGWGLALYEGRAARTFLEPAGPPDPTLAAHAG